MKRIIAMMLAAIMLVSLTACGSGSKDSAGSAGTTVGPASSDTANTGAVSGDPAGSASSEKQEDPKQEPAGTLPEIDSELFKEIPPIDRLSVTEYAWVEKDGYGALIMKGIEFYPYDIIQEALGSRGYSGGGGWGWDAKELEAQNYKQWVDREAKYLQVIHCGRTDTLAIIAGEIPTNYTCMQLVGLEAAELGEPKFEGRVYDLVPKTNRQTIHLSYADCDWEDEQGLCRMRDVTVRRLDAFIDFMEANGYEKLTREMPDDQSVYYEGRILAHRDLNMYVTLQLALTDGKLLMVVSAPGKELTKDEMWDGARAYEGDKDGIDPDAPPMDGYAAIDLSAAEASVEKGCTAYRFENIEHTQSVLEYMKSLRAHGYHGCDFWYKGYEPDTFSGSIVGDGTKYNVFESLTNGTDYVFVSYYDGRLLVLKSDKMITWSEMELCAAVDMPYVPGVNYLCGVAQEVLQGYGRSYDTNGHAAEYMSGADVAAYRDTVKWAQDQGFTNILDESQNGSRYEFHAWRPMPEGSRYSTLYVHIFLDGDYLEAQVSFERSAQIMGK